MIKLIAPRPLFISNCSRDGLTPKPSVELCIAIAKETYAKDHASDRFEYQFEDTDKHLVSPKTFSNVIEWFARWLKPKDTAQISWMCCRGLRKTILTQAPRLVTTVALCFAILSPL